MNMEDIGQVRSMNEAWIKGMLVQQFLQHLRRTFALDHITSAYQDVFVTKPRRMIRITFFCYMWILHKDFENEMKLYLSWCNISNLLKIKARSYFLQIYWSELTLLSGIFTVQNIHWLCSKTKQYHIVRVGCIDKHFVRQGPRLTWKKSISKWVGEPD